MPTANDVLQYLFENSPWVDRDRTVDGVKAGNPGREITKAGVCWMPSLSNLQAAHAAGCQLLVTHEPTFWEHSVGERRWRALEPGKTKQAFLDETGLVVLRAHDTWDNWPGAGIRDSWAQGLGLGAPIREGSVWRLHGLYEIPEQSLREFATYILERIAPLGEDSVQVIGDPNRRVRRPALGVGCIGPDTEMVEAGADVLIVCFDGACYWGVRERLAEMGVAIITVEHGSTEMWGLENLCRHLAEVYPQVEFKYFAEHPRTWTVKAP